MSKTPTPKADALRAMREARYDEWVAQQKAAEQKPERKAASPRKPAKPKRKAAAKAKGADRR